MYNLMYDTIDKNQLFLNQVPKRYVKTINDEKIFIKKNDDSLLISNDRDIKFKIIPFIEGHLGFGVIFNNKHFIVPINYSLNTNRDFKKLFQYFNSYLIESILINIS